MEFSNLLGTVISMLGQSKFGILTTIDEEGFPHSRWMTPTALGRTNGAIYAVTADNLAKARQVRANPKVAWGFQSRDLGAVACLRGLARLVVDPLLAAEVLESIGPNLGVFWRLSGDPRRLVVLETKVKQISLFNSVTLEHFEAEAGHAV
ncbi:MAG TPA: pyridoxamine 5'-phosphate oxidase family protein [Rectinemataceae bacterium]|nr:pyridoxamine 5'-phosphate oxidase family protein [Rectinemataceae bacterium]